MSKPASQPASEQASKQASKRAQPHMIRVSASKQPVDQASWPDPAEAAARTGCTLRTPAAGSPAACVQTLTDEHQSHEFPGLRCTTREETKENPRKQRTWPKAPRPSSSPSLQHAYTHPVRATTKAGRCAGFNDNPSKGRLHCQAGGQRKPGASSRPTRGGRRRRRPSAAGLSQRLPAQCSTYTCPPASWGSPGCAPRAPVTRRPAGPRPPARRSSVP